MAPAHPNWSERIAAAYTDPRTRHLLEVNRTLFQWCVQQAVRRSRDGAHESALLWVRAAATFAWGQGCHGIMNSADLEQVLARAAARVPSARFQAVFRKKPRCLHVFSEAYALYGHTKLCRVWVGLDQAMQHDLLLLQQLTRIPDNLKAVIEGGGGTWTGLDRQAPLLERAAKLRQHAWAHADLVVLHTHPFDVVAPVAFGVEGGPPVVLMNHADHAFWLGGHAVDLVLCIRETSAEWTSRYRGINRHALLPVPLQPPLGEIADDGYSPSARQAARRQLGLPEDALVFLTIGNQAKYRLMPEMDFVASTLGILRQVKNARLLFVGAPDEGRWRWARQQSGDRWIPCGEQADLAPYHAAADVYLEGFPFGSLTALLEAGLAALPCVRSPEPTPPLCCSSGVALDGVPRPRHPEEYVAMAVALAHDPSRRLAEGKALRCHILSHHCDAGWRSYLDLFKARLPACHHVHFSSPPASVPELYGAWDAVYWGGPLPSWNWREYVEKVLRETLRVTGESENLMDLDMAARLEQLVRGPLPSSGENSAGQSGGRRLQSTLQRLVRESRRDAMIVEAWETCQTGAVTAARRKLAQALRAFPGCLWQRSWLALCLELFGGRRLRLGFRHARLYWSERVRNKRSP